MCTEPFRKLLKLASRAFYDDAPTKRDGTPKTQSNRGMAVVILGALTRGQWVREEHVAKELKIRLNLKQLRRTMRFSEEEKLIMRDHATETAKGMKTHAVPVVATVDGQHSIREGDEKIKLQTHSYSCLDYAQVASCSTIHVLSNRGSFNHPLSRLLEVPVLGDICTLD